MRYRRLAAVYSLTRREPSTVAYSCPSRRCRSRSARGFRSRSLGSPSSRSCSLATIEEERCSTNRRTVAPRDRRRDWGSPSPRVLGDPCKQGPPVSERCPQGQLDLSRIVGLAGNQSKRCASERCIGWGKLDSIEKVKEFCSEIHADLFGYGSELRHGEIPIVDALGAQRRIEPRLVSQTEQTWGRKTCGVHDRISSDNVANDRASNRLVTLQQNIGADRAGSEVSS
jgi:hypothetical protein